MPPLNLVPGLADQMGAIMLVQGVLAALVARERLGVGQKVDTSLLGSMVALEGLILAARLVLGQEFPRSTRAKAGNPLWNHYQCGDGNWLILAHLQPDRYWPALCKALGVPELEKDPRFVDMEARSQNCEELIAIMDGIFASKPRGEWLSILKEHGIITTSIQTVAEVVSDPQVLANDYVTDFQHPDWGPIKVVGLPFKFSKTPGEIRLPAPEFGQHTEEVLLELGYTWDDIVQLRDDQVI